MAKKPIIVVTGATGFIAKHVVLALLQAGYKVRGSSRAAGRIEELRTALTPRLGEEIDLDEDLVLSEADLTRPGGWQWIMAGADALIHTASPFPERTPRDADLLIRPAVAGTQTVLGAAAEAGLARVVLTSSAAAIGYGHPQRTRFDESVWSNLDGPGVGAYTRSKTLAERAAWALAAERDLKLTAINPTLVLGPALDRHYGTSVKIVESLLSGRIPALPRLQFGVVDVRDVADLHVAALRNDESAGKRYLGVAGMAEMAEVAAILRAAYPEARVARRMLPDFVLKAAAFIDRDAAQLAVDLGRRIEMDNGAGRALLGRDFRSAEDAVLASAQSLYALKILRR